MKSIERVTRLRDRINNNQEMRTDNKIDADDGCTHCDNSNGSNCGVQTYDEAPNAGNNSDDCNYRHHSFCNEISMNGRQKIFNDEIVTLSDSSREGTASRDIEELEDDFYR